MTTEQPQRLDTDAILERLRGLHAPVDNMAGRKCAGCMYDDPFDAHDWPCPTILIVHGLNTQTTPTHYQGTPVIPIPPISSDAPGVGESKSPE